VGNVATFRASHGGCSLRSLGRLRVLDDVLVALPKSAVIHQRLGDVIPRGVSKDGPEFLAVPILRRTDFALKRVQVVDIGAHKPIDFSTRSLANANRDRGGAYLTSLGQRALGHFISEFARTDSGLTPVQNLRATLKPSRLTGRLRNLRVYRLDPRDRLSQFRVNGLPGLGENSKGVRVRLSCHHAVDCLTGIQQRSRVVVEGRASSGSSVPQRLAIKHLAHVAGCPLRPAAFHFRDVVELIG
jgi:hypothetical protein